MPGLTMTSLLQSRWAPRADEAKAKTKTQASRSSSRSRSKSKSRNANVPSPAQELSRFMKIAARIKWKLPFLAEGYRLATLRTGSDADVAHAEIMFKIDFFEYYALLERAIVHLLGVFGVAVSGGVEASYWSSKRGRRNGTGSPVPTHRYHANVLSALERESCPLHSVLGTGKVYEQLKKAKELRNRWKTADMSKEEEDASCQPRNRAVIPLEHYDFEQILSQIFTGFEDGCTLAREHVASVESGNGQGQSGDSEADWDFIVDAMDWEAV
ncbi:hypothetical protein ETB97_002073 [Aspergillus alliaceus]|uniref:Fungal specific transcription factor n=1 Tax=Petromyces alliaceus TaxID=209559 RepID=A0A8H6A1X5_PETAA|nr:hypothetical protein ETB97_002073 [Aspergillus burnettii]